MPQCMPMIGALEQDEQGDHILFLHGQLKQMPLKLPVDTYKFITASGHPSSRIYKRLNQPDVRIVATGTILDGYILALSSFSSSMNYRSAVLHGFTSPISNNMQDKTEGFARITERTIPGRWSHARKPTAAEYKGTAVIKVIIDSARYVFVRPHCTPWI
jgi:nitroimidazol reductase NimA-like FMN-containing flavoprotein (pyridoxamine 5'-phosphate oxidase superfamily)